LVIIFQNEKARKHLLERGFVYTARTRARASTVLEDWMTDKRGGKKIANVLIEPIVVCALPAHGFPTELLELYVKHSGFDTVDEWVEAIKKFHPNRPVRELWIYKVHIRISKPVVK